MGYVSCFDILCFQQRNPRLMFPTTKSSIYVFQQWKSSIYVSNNGILLIYVSNNRIIDLCFMLPTMKLSDLCFQQRNPDLCFQQRNPSIYAQQQRNPSISGSNNGIRRFPACFQT
ncbi:hypothetical protein CEXT_71441 [Caerostris extrusa]|uniref:Uncharacterized protein n=1 Tax=Caerostris extrusa TaxID=172846 RepID=A0AAV4XAH6_CAEEX|nr:hypothetical protein CEXT_71441 [Caerostris extrusa]